MTKKINSGIFDLGTGNGYLIRDIINFTNFPMKNIKKKNNIEEIHNSIANKQNLQKVISKYKFKNIETYLKKKIKYKE